MPVSAGMSVLIILAMAAATFAARVTPFLLFPGEREVPEIVRYLGRVLPPAVIGLLLVLCLKDIDIFGSSHGIPEIVSVALIVVLHRWRRNTLLSVGGGTAFYMLLLRLI